MRLKVKDESLQAEKVPANGGAVRKGNGMPATPHARPAKRLKILLIDDHAMLLDTLRRQFDADPAFQVVATADSLDSAREAVDLRCPDIVLLDIQLGLESGLDAIGFIRRARPDVRIVMLSMFDQPIYRDRAFELGAAAYVTKGASFESLRRLLLDGTVSPAEDSNGRIMTRPHQMQSLRLALTERELQVIHALASGKREKEVAEELNVSVSSVGTYLKRSMAKVGVTTRAELFRHAGALGIQTAAAVQINGTNQNGRPWKS